MKKNPSSFPALFAVIIIALSFLFYQTARRIGAFDAGDSFAYAELGEYLLNNRFINERPAYDYLPQTLFAPVYAIFITPLLSLSPPLGSYMLPFLQLMLVLTGAVILYPVIQKLFSPATALLGTILYIIFPFNIIHATFIMSETLTTVFVVFYVFTLYFWTRKAVWATTGLLVFTAAVLVLTRYAFVPWFILTFGLYLWDLKQKPRYHHIFGVFALIVIGSWMLFNYRIFGYFTLSTVSGRHLFNNVVSTGHLVPPKDNPKTSYFYSHMPLAQYPLAMFAPWWDVQSMIKDGSLTERQLDRVFMDTALAALFAHPIQYIFHVINMTIITPLTAPKFMTHNLDHIEACDSASCRVKWNSYLCQPVEFSCRANTAFLQYTRLNQAFYPLGAAVFFLLGIIGIASAVYTKQFFWIAISTLFITQHVFQSATEWLESRFLIPLYPLYILLILMGIRTCTTYLQRTRTYTKTPMI